MNSVRKRTSGDLRAVVFSAISSKMAAMITICSGPRFDGVDVIDRICNRVAPVSN